MAVAAGEVGSDGSALAVELVAGAAEGGEERFALRWIGGSDGLGSEDRLPVCDLRLHRLGRVAQLSPDLGELLGQGLVAEALDLAGLEGADGVAGHLPFGDAVEQALRVAGAGDEGVDADGTVDAVALPLADDAGGHLGIVVAGESEDGFAGEDAVVGPALQHREQVGRRVAEEVGQGGATGTGIGFLVLGDGEQLIAGAAVSEDDGEFADEGLRFLVPARLGDGIPGGGLGSLGPAAQGFVEAAQDVEAVFVGGAGEEVVDRLGSFFEILGEASGDEAGDGGEFGIEGEIDVLIGLDWNRLGNPIPDHERLLAVAGVFGERTEVLGNYSLRRKIG